MEIFFLGAGSPRYGKTPSALKNILFSSNVLDWQISAFSETSGSNNIHFLGGYQIEDVVNAYPKLHFTVVPEWETHDILQTFFHIPFTNEPCFICYSDTIFHAKTIQLVEDHAADVVYCVDSQWKNRFSSRSQNNLRSAEKITLQLPNGEQSEVEFTGLVRFSKKAISLISNLKKSEIGSSILDLISYLQSCDLDVRAVDILGSWAELDSTEDIANFILGTKAETLARLQPIVKKSHIGRQVSFTIGELAENPDFVVSQIQQRFSPAPLIIRSSSKSEDGWETSNAGKYESLLNIPSTDTPAVLDGIQRVIASYGEKPNENDQVLVQEFIPKVRMAGVVFTCGLENGAPYYRFNFDDQNNSTESVTAGTHDDLRTIIVSRINHHHLEAVEPKLLPVLEAVQEIEALLGFDKLDIEFAVDDEGLVHIFQVRPIAVDHDAYEVNIAYFESSIKQSIQRFGELHNSSPFVFGDRTVLANMPDWNPAEIIGTKPKPLALSLYQYLIVDEVWAQQRAEFGYRDVRPYPLIYTILGQPYVDARASLNSFIPADIPDETARSIAKAYINILAENPAFHDKIEFEVAFTIWTPKFRTLAEERLVPYGVTLKDIDLLEESLKVLTRSALTRLRSDTASLQMMVARRQIICSSQQPLIDKIHLLLDDCRSFGTLAFSHAARAGFVATTLLKSMVATDVLSQTRCQGFLKSFHTVAGDFENAKRAFAMGQMSSSDLIDGFGHLRPGTYDITAKAYWENPENYLFIQPKYADSYSPKFEFTAEEQSGIQSCLQDLNSIVPVGEFTQYLVEATQAREFVKFEFTKNLSKALDYIVALADEFGITRDEAAFLDLHDLHLLKTNRMGAIQIREAIGRNRSEYTQNSFFQLPNLISKQEDFYAFEYQSSLPNFVTTKKIEAPVEVVSKDAVTVPNGSIVLIERADPGYDWLFGQGITGLITKYGGANSHMAIRAAEIGLPAAIGVGQKLFEDLAKAKRLQLDCAGQAIRHVS